MCLCVSHLLYPLICQWMCRWFACLGYCQQCCYECSESCSVVSDSVWPMDCNLTGSSVHGILQARILEWVASILPLLQGIFPTQGPNPGLLHCRWILCDLSTREAHGHRVHASFWTILLPWHMPGVGFLDHMATLFLVFWGTTILFSIVAAPMYIPTNRVGRFPFLHTLSSICFL